jgi:hypothetical protein
MFRPTLSCLSAIVIALASQQAQATNILLNGSFENGTISSNPATGVFGGTIDDWDLNDTLAPLATDNPNRHTSASLEYVDPVDGTYAFAIEKTFSAGPANGIQQDLGPMAAGQLWTFDATILGFTPPNGDFSWTRDYQIAFYNVTDNTILAMITEVDFPVGNTTNAPITMAYTTLSSDNGDIMRLVIAPRLVNGDVSRVGIDAASVTVVPEPSGLTLLIVGSFGFIAMRRRRGRIVRS